MCVLSVSERLHNSLCSIICIFMSGCTHNKRQVVIHRKLQLSSVYFSVILLLTATQMIMLVYTYRMQKCDQILCAGSRRLAKAGYL